MGSFFFGFDFFDMGVKSKDRVNKFMEMSVVFFFMLGLFRFVFFFSELFVVMRVGIFVDFFVVLFEIFLRVEVVEEVIEVFDVFFGGVEVIEFGNGLDFGEMVFMSKEGIGLGIEFFGRKFFEVGNFVVDVLVDRVELMLMFGVGKGFMG